MLRFYDYKGNETPMPTFGLQYVIIETKNDEKHFMDIVDKYTNRNCGLEGYIIEKLVVLRDCIDKYNHKGQLRGATIMLKEDKYLSPPHIWIYNSILWQWTLLSDIIYDATKLNSKLKFKFKTENQIRNSNSDSEIENEIRN